MVTKLKRLKLKNIGVFLCVAIFGIISFTGGMNFEKNAIGQSSLSVLSPNKGGTGSRSIEEIRTNLGFSTTLSSASTDEQFPSSKAVYDYGQPIETGTIPNKYFDIYYEKYNNKRALIQIVTSNLKASIVTAGSQETLGAAFPASITPRNTHLYLLFNICDTDCANYNQYWLYLSDASSRLFFPHHESADGKTIIISTPTYYETKN
jgi:hypothetical protein